MHKFIVLFLGMGIGCFFPLCPANAAAALIGHSPCSPVGKTMMDTDQNSIIACVCKTSGCDTTNSNNLIWKAMSNTNNICPAGQVVTGITNGQPTCNFPSNVVCPSGQLMVGFSGVNPKCVAGYTMNFTCPAGQAISKFVNGVPSCIAPTPAPPPPPPCAALNKYCVDGVGCSGGCFGDFNISLPAGGTSASLGGNCHGPDYSCGGHSCNFNIDFTGTATCSGGTWVCNISSMRTTYMDGYATGKYADFSYSGACSGL